MSTSLSASNDSRQNLLHQISDVGNDKVQSNKFENAWKDKSLLSRLKSSKYNWKNITVATCLWLVYTLCSVAYSIINPFFPGIVCINFILLPHTKWLCMIVQANEKQASPAFIGLIISSSPTCVVLISPLLGYMVYNSW